jgi:hypothetical protein
MFEQGMDAEGNCTLCGDDHGSCCEQHMVRCPWLDTCKECSRVGGEGTNLDMAADRLCVDCDEHNERVRRQLQADPELECPRCEYGFDTSGPGHPGPHKPCDVCGR